VADRFANVLYCDDVRHELDGKRSYIGVYGTHLLADSFPLAVSKLCVVITVTSPRNMPFKKFGLYLINGEQEVAAAEMPLADVEKAMVQLASTPNRDPESEGFLAMQGIFEIQNIVFPEPAVLRVLVRTEGADVQGQPLRVEMRSTTVPA
jgi:hypothetical protein